MVGALTLWADGGGHLGGGKGMVCTSDDLHGGRILGGTAMSASLSRQRCDSTLVDDDGVWQMVVVGGQSSSWSNGSTVWLRWRSLMAFGGRGHVGGPKL